MSRARNAAVGLVSLASLLVAAGCGEDASRDTGRGACSADSDCSDGERCEVEPAPLSYPRIVVPCPYAPCGPSGECAEGFVCRAGPTSTSPPSACAPMVCMPSCTTTGCSEGLVCLASGVCGVLHCDEPGGEACPEHWRCDPPAALTEPGIDSGSVIERMLEDDRAIMRGCVRKRCDEADGYVCKEFWRCAPRETTGGSGCVAIPCQESGHCEDDNYICEPTSSAPRFPGQDYYGCVSRNCEEGRVCLAPTVSDPSVAYCDPSAANADMSGCALRTCAEGNHCVETYVCNPSSPQADSIGCVPGPDSGGSAGTIGTGNSGSTSTGGTGGTTSTGGSGGAPAGDGRCVEK